MFEMDVVVLIIVGIFFLFIGYRPPWWKKNKSDCKKTIKDVPGPCAVPILGTSWVYTKIGGYTLNKMHEFHRTMFDYYGSIIKEEALFNVPVISIKDKKDIEKVVRHCGKYPVRPPTEAITHYRKSRPDVYASMGMVHEQGLKWHKLRYSLTSELTNPKTVSQFLPECANIAVDFCKMINRERSSDGTIADFQLCTARLGLETVCAMVLGRRMGFLEADSNLTELSKRLATASQEHFEACSDTYYGLPLWKLWPTDVYRRLVKQEEAMFEMVTEIIEQSDAQLQNSSVFHSIVNAHEIDERDRKMALIEMVEAGIQTISNTMIFLLDLMGCNQDAQRKLSDSLDDDEHKDSSYLKACIMEAYRMKPTALTVARILERDLELGGYHLDAGTVILMHTAAACLEERYFRKAHEYRPERWLGEEKNETANNAIYLVTPFGVGRRSCPGKRFIEQTLPIVLAEVVKEFEISCPEPLDVEFRFLLTPKDPVKMKFVNRR